MSQYSNNFSFSQLRGFRPESSQAKDGQAWLFGTANPMGFTDREETPLSFPVAEGGGKMLLLFPTLLNARGELEEYQLLALDERGDGTSLVNPASVPSSVLRKLESIATKHNLQGLAGYHSLTLQDGEGLNGDTLPSHIIRKDGAAWHFMEEPQAVGGFFATVLREAGHDPDGVAAHIRLEPTDFNESGHIAAYDLSQQQGNMWLPTTQDALPPRVLEELVRFADRFQHFGIPPREAETPSQQADRILAQTDMDGGIQDILHHGQQILTGHLRGEVNAALDVLGDMAQEVTGRPPRELWTEQPPSQTSSQEEKIPAPSALGLLGEDNYDELSQLATRYTRQRGPLLPEQPAKSHAERARTPRSDTPKTR